MSALVVFDSVGWQASQLGIWELIDAPYATAATEGAIVERLKLYPEEAVLPNARGALPLHDWLQRGLMAASERRSGLLRIVTPRNTLRRRRETKQAMAGERIGERPPRFGRSVASRRLAVLHALLRANPSAAGARYGPCGSLPIHLACRASWHFASTAGSASTSVRVIRALHSTNPLGVAEQGAQGKTPLHHAVVAAGRDDVGAGSAGGAGGAGSAAGAGCAAGEPPCDAKDGAGAGSVAAAARRAASCPSVAAFEAVLELYPLALTVADGWGRLPLHMATTSTTPPRVVECLLDGYRSAASRADEGGNLPLHYAVTQHAPKPNLERILEAHIPALWRENRDGKTPAQLAECEWKPSTGARVRGWIGSAGRYVAIGALHILRAVAALHILYMVYLLCRLRSVAVGGAGEEAEADLEALAGPD